MQNIRQRILLWLLPAVVIIITALAFAELPQQDFLTYDDGITVYANPSYLPPSMAGVTEFWRHGQPQLRLYFPVTQTIWAIAAHFAYRSTPHLIPGDTPTPLDPTVFHCLNLALHLLNVALVFFLLRALLIQTQSAAATEEKSAAASAGSTGIEKSSLRLTHVTMAAAAGALLFGVHPLQVEAVDWIAELKGILCGSFTLGALLLWVSSSRAEQTHARRAWALASLATASFALALLSKPSAVAAPLLAWVLERYVLRDGSSLPVPRRLLLAGWLAMAATLAAVTHTVQPVAMATPPWWQRFFVMGDAYAFYVGKLLLPLHLGPYYGRTPRVVLHNWWGYCTWIVPAALLALAWYARRWDRRPLAAVLFLYAALLPNSGLVPFIFQHVSTVADRYFYIAMFGASLGLSWTLLRWREPRLYGACVLLLLGCCFGTALQTLSWENNYIFYTHAIAVNPDNYMPHAAYAVVLKSSGRYDEALNEFKKGLRLNTDDPRVPYDYGNFLFKLHRFSEAAQAQQQAISFDPAFLDAYENLGYCYLAEHRKQDAIATWEKALRIRSDYLPANRALASVNATG